MLRAGYNIYIILICQIDYTVKSVCLVFLHKSSETWV